jgi:hypothetical protein
MAAVVSVAALCAACGSAAAQNVVGDLLGGKLIDPKVGQWIWYRVSDSEGEATFWIRQAVVGEETIDRDKGLWVEYEFVPEVGYRTIYKVFLAGPATDPDSIKRILVKQGPEPVQEMDVDPADFEAEDEGRPSRESKGMEEVQTDSGVIRAEHLEVVEAGRTIHLWVNEKVKPSGLVRMTTPDGEMLLSRFGRGGEYGESVIDRQAASQPPRVETHNEAPDAAPEKEAE